MEKVSNNGDQTRNKPSDNNTGESKSRVSQGSSALAHSEHHGMHGLDEARRKWHDLEHAMRAKGHEASQAGRVYIHQNPIKSVLVASAAGMVLGFLFSVFRK